jgi:hypothetical protein
MTLPGSYYAKTSSQLLLQQSPPGRGESKYVLAAHLRPSCTKPVPSSASKKNKGRRSAEKAQLSRGASPRIGCCHPTALRARPRVQRDALAFRRSTAALAEALTPQLSSGPRFLEPPGANGRTLPGASAASSSQTGHSAGRAGPRSRPGAECVVPPAGTALAPLSKAPSRRCP